MTRNHMRVGRAVIVAVVVAALFATAPPPASACSCAAAENPRATLAAADGAFVGTVERVEREAREISGPHDRAAFHYRVERAVKGDIGATVVVHTRGDGASCGLEGEPGTRTALFVGRDEAGNWTAGLCSTIGIERLLEAARPLRVPDGRGPPAFVVGAALGEHRTMLLDADGRTLAYGDGPAPDAGAVASLDACPGGRFVVEGLLAAQAGAESVVVVVRSIEGFRIVRTVRVADLPDVAGSFVYAHEVACRDEAAQVLDVALAHHTEDTTFGRLLRLDGSRARTVWQGREVSFDLADDAPVALAWQRDTVERVHLASGARQTIHQSGSVAQAALSPDGAATAVVLTGESTYRAERLLVLDSGTGRTRAAHDFRPQPDVARLVWMDERTLALTTGPQQATLTFFDAGLRAVGTVTGWHAAYTFAAGGRVYGVAYGPEPIVTAGRGTRAAKTFTRLPDGATRAFVALPAPASAAPESTTTTTAATEPAAPSERPDDEAALTAVDAAPATATSASRPWRLGLVSAALLLVVAAAAARYGGRTRGRWSTRMRGGG